MKTTEQKNRMIAEFMGFKPENEVVNFAQPDGYTRAKSVIAYQIEPKRTDGFTNLTHDFMLKYHKSWDWLMPVVEKIERLGFTIEKNFQPVDNDWQCLVVKGNDILFQEFNEQSIQAMHYVVSEFIEMYNNKNK